MLKAKWIWQKQENYNLYNQTIIARKIVRLKDIKQAEILITADSFYRLFINGEWINDGPCRAWPEHYQYDKIDVTSNLKTGENEIYVIAKYWGVGTFHNVCQQAGLLAQIEVTKEDGETQFFFTDQTWEVSDAKAWISNTPKVSIQMEPQEFYDSRFENQQNFSDAKVLFDAEKGPWKDLHPRDVALLTKQPFSFKRILGANIIERKKDIHFCLPTARLVHPGLIEANHNTSNACGMATLLQIEEAAQVKLDLAGFKLSVDGQINDDGYFNLNPGIHLVLAFVSDVVGHRKEKTLRFVDPPASLTLTNPINSNHENPWCWISFPEYAKSGTDIKWGKWGIDEKGNKFAENYLKDINSLLTSVKDINSFRTLLGDRVQNLSLRQMFVRDTHWQFTTREVIGDAIDLVANPAGLMFNNNEFTVIRASSDGDIELVYDFGQQNCGYYYFELIADQGVEIDIYGIEFIAQNGAIQHTEDNRNGMRYITKAGVNKFISLKRRSGRYIFITFRNQKSPVKIRNFQLIESTYPVNQIGSFQCNDTRLDRIWDISAHTLKLCMEDTFTDCPLYEQTLWVGDARNEAVFAFPVYGATDIAKRCIRLAGQSLERFPITGCQVPSAWKCVLPAWSFLWGISVWDYYDYSGDKKFLQDSWHWVIQNLKGAESLLNNSGLFSAQMWNLFDWSGIDDGHKIVSHNSMLIVGATNAAIKSAEVLNDQKNLIWLKALRNNLSLNINKLWDDNRKAYIDSIHDDGKLSKSISQHTSFLSVLYDIVELKNKDAAINNILNPPKEMVKVGAPFAIMYLYETLEKIGKQDEIIKSIYKSYLPMLEAGATTVWEIFPSSNYRPGKFPTRSHCHAWSSAPLYFLNRIILGIKPTVPGGKEFEISPRINGLTWARGSVATINGSLEVSWKIDGNNLLVQVSAPDDVAAKFKKNDTHKPYKVKVEINGEQT